MIADRDLERTLAAWLRPGPVDAPDYLIDSILTDVGQTAQRRQPRLRRWKRMRSMPLRVAGLAAVLIAATISASWLLERQPGHGAGGLVPVPSDLLVLTATDVAFDKSDLYGPVDRPFVIRLINTAAIPHGLVVTAPSGEVVFTGSPFVGPDTQDLEIPGLGAGRYAFADPVHPFMSGTLHIGTGGPQTGAPSTASPSPSRTISPDATGVVPSDLLVLTAADVAFDQSDLYGPRDHPFVIRFISTEAVPHGLDVTAASGQVVFSAPISIGPDKRDLEIPALAAGQYAFADPVHPNMQGILHVVAVVPPPPAPTATGTAPPADVVVTIDGTGFSPDQLTFAGGRRFWIELVNEDPGVEHGIYLFDAAGTNMFSAGWITGPATTRYPIDALPAGTYTIVDPKHTDVTATLKIGG